MNESQVRWASGLSLLAGLWLVFSPLWVSNSSTGNIWQIVLGIVIAVLALGQMMSTRVSWPSWINLLGGIYFIIAPLVTSTSSAVRWNQIVPGVIVGLVSIWSIYEASSGFEQTRATTSRPADAFYEKMDGKDQDRRS